MSGGLTRQPAVIFPTS